MSHLNKQNCKALALDLAKKHHPEKTRISSDFIDQLDTLVQHIIEAMVRDNDQPTKTLMRCDWADRIIARGEEIHHNEKLGLKGEDDE
jgi:hypothetical protein